MSDRPLKAYLIDDYNRVADYCTVVFAENRGKARAYAHFTDEFMDFDFTDLRATRVPKLDSYYRGKPKMDWFDSGDREGLVRYAGMYCGYDYDTDDCENCSGKDFCSRYESMKEEEEDDA